MKNRLLITPYVNQDKEVAYKVEDSFTVYMITRNKTLAEETYNYLKLEYQQELKNASKI
jgi:hypothetical protein|tara:strand:- start:88 stop:264 length:177 start_codon:yes stop_codon:yes gene_type:complete